MKPTKLMKREMDRIGCSWTKMTNSDRLDLARKIVEQWKRNGDEYWHEHGKAVFWWARACYQEAILVPTDEQRQQLRRISLHNRLGGQDNLLSSLIVEYTRRAREGERLLNALPSGKELEAVIAPIIQAARFEAVSTVERTHLVKRSTYLIPSNDDSLYDSVVVKNCPFWAILIARGRPFDPKIVPSRRAKKAIALERRKTMRTSSQNNVKRRSKLSQEAYVVESLHLLKIPTTEFHTGKWDNTYLGAVYAKAASQDKPKCFVEFASAIMRELHFRETVVRKADIAAFRVYAKEQGYKLSLITCEQKIIAIRKWLLTRVQYPVLFTGWDWKDLVPRIMRSFPDLYDEVEHRKEDSPEAYGAFDEEEDSL